MKRIVRTAAILGVLIGALVSGTIIHGRVRPKTSDLALYGLEMCGEAPCLRGLQPGQTRFQQVPSLLGSDVRRRSVNEMSLTMTRGDAYIIAGDEIPDTNTRVLLVHLSPRVNESLPRVGEFVRQYGVPCGVIPVTASSIKLLYPSMELGVTAYSDHLQVGSPVYSLTLYSRGLKCARRAKFEWAGFTSMSQYQLQARQ